MKYEEMSGQKNQGMVGKKPQDILPETQAQAIEARYAQCVQTRKNVVFEEYLSLPVGPRWWQTMLVPIADEDPGAEEMRAVADELTRWEKPALVAFSDSDPVFPFPRGGEAFIKLLPGVEDQVKIEGAAHFLQEDRGELIAEEMLRFLGDAGG